MVEARASLDSGNALLVSDVTTEQRLCFRDLDFAGSYVERRSTRGVPFLKWEPCGVPRISDKHLDNAFYLYRDVESAREGKGAGGTGFLVSVDSPFPGLGFNYAVTNYHVAIARGFSVIRLNTTDGGHDIIELGPEDWEFDALTGTDIAVAQVRTDQTVHKAPVAPLDCFVTQEFLREANVGIGDEVFMVGRFVDHDGGPTNRPAARFGHVSIMPSPLRMEDSGKTVDVFCCDMNSRSGYSGSPVWVYRTPGRDLEKHDFTKFSVVTTGGSFLMLLGIHYGQFPEFWKIVDGAIVAESEPETKVGSLQQVRGMSGMTCVLPAWRIAEILNQPKFKDGRDRDNKVMAERQAVRPVRETG